MFPDMRRIGRLERPEQPQIENAVPAETPAQ
jgi:hypothetical protein